MHIQPFAVHQRGLTREVQHPKMQVVVMHKPSTAHPSLTVRSTRTQPRAMPSAFSWPLLVPSALTGSGAGYLGS
jgi:hypothetical protein